MKKRHYLVMAFVSGLLVVGGISGRTLWNQQYFTSLVATPDQVPKWEADPRPLQAESVVRDQLKQLNRHQENKGISFDESSFLVIPGLRGAWSIDYQTKQAAFGTDWVPQGLTQSQDHYYISVYDGDHRLNSLIFQIDKKSKKYVKSLILPSKAHVGGISYDDERRRLIYSDDTNKKAGFGFLDQAVIDDYQAAAEQAPIISQKSVWPIGIRTSSLTLYRNQLIVAKYGFNKEERSIVSVPLNQAGGLPTIRDDGSPELAKALKTGKQKEIEKAFIQSLIQQGAISSYTPGWDRMQGVSLAKSGLMIVSQSNGHRPGKLRMAYRLPDPSRWEKIDLLKRAVDPGVIEVPWGVEEVSINEAENQLAVIFESGAKKYRQNKMPFLTSHFMDRVLLLPLQVTEEN